MLPAAPAGDGALLHAIEIAGARVGWLCLGGGAPMADPAPAGLDSLLDTLVAQFAEAVRGRHAETALPRRLDVQEAVSTLLARMDSLDDAAPAVLEAICRRLGFVFGSLRDIDPQRQAMRTVALWHAPDPALAEFAEGSRPHVFARGVGLVGRAWQEGRPVWFEDGEMSGQFLRARAASLAGFHAAVALPIFAGGEVVGVLAFLAQAPLRADQEMLGIFTMLGSQLGQFVERRRQENEIRHVNRLYSVLSAINRLMVKAEGREELFSGACRIAHELGGFGAAAIGSYDPVLDQVVSVQGYGDSRATIGPSHDVPLHSVPPDGRGEVTRAVIGARLVFENDLAASPERGGDRRRALIQLGYRSCAALPLMLDGKVVGVFILYSREPGYFTPPVLALLEEVAADIGFGLDHIRSRDRLAYLTHHDPLTGLPNRVLFEDRLGQAMIAAGRAGTRIAVLFMDIRRFRDFNHLLGRKEGDRLLQQFAHRLQAVSRNPENLARIGGDHFATFLPDVGDAFSIARRVEQGLNDSVTEATAPDGHALRLTGIVGVAVYPDDGGDVATLLRNVSAALFNAKATGRQLLFYEPSLNAHVADKLRMTGRLLKAAERAQFQLHYQPKIHARGGALHGVEALMRWQDGDRGFVPPAEFIPLLEDSGLIRDVGFWAIRQALVDRRGWRAAGIQAPRVAVNVSPIQFQDDGFIPGICRLLEEFGDGDTAGGGLDIEITESLIMTDVAGTIAKLDTLRQMGIGIAVDDFGTGYSSLSYLARLPVHALKIDRSFVGVMAESSESMMIIQAIITLAHGLDLTVVAEGVETEEQAKLLRLLRCDELQGFHFAHPMPAATLAASLSAS
ncbi:hypothetical protein STHU_18220 [Allostella humosa]|nr:hypothetical protein STHU_18220 [Stella humosa]